MLEEITRVNKSKQTSNVINKYFKQFDILGIITLSNFRHDTHIVKYSRAIALSP